MVPVEKSKLSNNNFFVRFVYNENIKNITVNFCGVKNDFKGVASLWKTTLKHLKPVLISVESVVGGGVELQWSTESPALYAEIFRKYLDREYDGYESVIKLKNGQNKYLDVDNINRSAMYCVLVSDDGIVYEKTQSKYNYESIFDKNAIFKVDSINLHFKPMARSSDNVWHGFLDIYGYNRFYYTYPILPELPIYVDNHSVFFDSVFNEKCSYILSFKQIENKFAYINNLHIKNMNIVQCIINGVVRRIAYDNDDRPWVYAIDDGIQKAYLINNNNDIVHYRNLDGYNVTNICKINNLMYAIGNRGDELRLFEFGENFSNSTVLDNSKISLDIYNQYLSSYGIIDTQNNFHSILYGINTHEPVSHLMYRNGIVEYINFNFIRNIPWLFSRVYLDSRNNQIVLLGLNTENEFIVARYIDNKWSVSKSRLFNENLLAMKCIILLHGMKEDGKIWILMEVPGLESNYFYLESK